MRLLNFNNHTFKFPAMNTSCKIVTPQKISKLLKKEILELVQDFENRISFFKPESETSKINQSPDSLLKITDPDIYEMIELGFYFSEKSDKLFDLGFKGTAPFHLSSLDNDMFFKPEGFILDFGGIGKEYILDKVKFLLINNGINESILNFGGDIVVIGKTSIGIKDPMNTKASIFNITINDGAICTSGLYENPAHIKTDGSIISASVIHKSATFAGFLSTMSILKGADAPLFLNQFACDFILVDKHKKIISSIK